MKSRRMPLWLLPLVVLAWRVAQLGKIEFVNPDSATYLRYDLLVLTQRLPFYPILVNLISRLGLEVLIAGKLVAALGAGGAVWLVSLAAVEAGVPRRDAWWAGVPLAVNPLFAVVTSQALTEGLFLCCGGVALLFALRFFRRRAGFDLFLFIFFAGLAALIRAEGMVFIPAIAVAFVLFPRRSGWIGEMPLALLGLAPWALLVVWHVLIILQGGYFQEYRLGLEAIVWSERLLHVAILPAAVLLQTMLVGGYFAVHGWRRLLRAGDPAAKTAGRLSLYLFLGTWLGVSMHWYFDLRLSVTPAFWLCLPFAFSVAEWRQRPSPVRQWVALLLATMMLVGIFAGLVLIDNTADLNRDGREAALLVGELPGEMPVHADEQAMFSYHLGRIVWPYQRELPDRCAIVVLSDRTSDLEAEFTALDDNYWIEELGIFDNGRENHPQQTVVWRLTRRPGIAVVAPPVSATPGPGD